MVKIPPIDLSEFVKLLNRESNKLAVSCLGKGKETFKILSEWNNIIHSLEVDFVPVLAKGGDVSHLAGPAKELAKSAGSLGAVASQILGFVPGPIGIVCSVINAIVCFCTLPFPVNIGNGMLELLGCIPGGKAVAKGGAKLAPEIERLIVAMLENSPEINKLIRESEKIAQAVKIFVRKKVKEPTGQIPIIYPVNNGVGFYSRLNIYNSGTMSSLKEAIQTNLKNSSMLKTGKPQPRQVQQMSINEMLYRLRTNTGKSGLF